MTGKFPLLRALALGIVALTGLSGLAATQKHISENCNDNSTASFWDHGGDGNVISEETNGRWEFSNIGPTGVLSSHGVIYNRNGINWRKDFHIEFDYRCKVNSVTGDKGLFLGAALPVQGDIPETMTGVACGLLRKSDGLWAGIMTWENGIIVDFEGVPISQITGKIEIDWDKSADRLTVHRSGGADATLDGYYAANGAQFGGDPMIMAFGVLTYHGNIIFSATNVRLDNIEMDYYSRPVP